MPPCMSGFRITGTPGKPWGRGGELLKFGGVKLERFVGWSFTVTFTKGDRRRDGGKKG